MTQEGFLQKYAAEDANTVRTLRNTVAAFIRHINNALQKLTLSNPIHREIYNSLNKDKQFFEELRKKATEALDSLPSAQTAAKSDAKRSEGKTNTKYSLRPGAAEDVRRALENKKYTEEVYLTDTTPSIIMSQMGAKNLPMLMSARHIRENVFTEDQAKKRGLRISKDINYHGLGEMLFLDVINDLENVTLAYRGTKKAADHSRRENYYLLISQHKDKDGNTINVPVYINQKGQYNRVFIDTNKVATVFGRMGIQGYIQKEIAAGNLVRIKNRSDQAGELSPPIRHSYGEIASTNSISPRQVESQENLSGKSETGKPDTKFSLKAPVEETKQLVAVHNFTTADLRNAAKLGGLAMPSIAILTSSQPHTRYGEISLVFRRSTIDPAADSRNAVYSGDAYTPTFLQTSFKISREVEERLSDLYYGLLAAQKTRRTTNAARR